MHNHGQNHCWVTHPHLRRVTSLISFNPHPVSPPSGFSLYSSCASLHFFIPFQLSPPAHLTSNCLWNKPGPTGTRQICTNTHSNLSGSEKHHSKTKKEINKIKKQHPVTSILTAICWLPSLCSVEKKRVFSTYDQCLWEGLERIGSGFWTTDNNTDHWSYYLWFVWDCNSTDDEWMD